jgi:hypothetical protein
VKNPKRNANVFGEKKREIHNIESKFGELNIVDGFVPPSDKQKIVEV